MHGMAAGTYPVLNSIEAPKFLKLLAGAEIALGLPLLSPPPWPVRYSRASPLASWACTSEPPVCATGFDPLQTESQSPRTSGYSESAPNSALTVSGTVARSPNRPDRTGVGARPALR